jgi:hypothetical protein
VRRIRVIEAKESVALDMQKIVEEGWLVGFVYVKVQL